MSELSSPIVQSQRSRIPRRGPSLEDVSHFLKLSETGITPEACPMRRNVKAQENSRNHEGDGQLAKVHPLELPSAVLFSLQHHPVPKMASRTALTRAIAPRTPTSFVPRRTFAHTTRLLETAGTVLPPKKPVGAFRGGLFGFLLGATGAGAAMYTYVVQEYKVSNEMLTEDIYNLQATVQRIESYVRVMEDKVENSLKKK
ncbi:uncharacterized protein PV09_05979 [Verruconis gallopava]|uniref:Uncharacterized protein n=1 Tax=Verruconis gallopava TaxID=253628 RepID=A0A0D2A853_9PEZI|nr:uncharacterized protein PV09_05979 [Verruconis gallopava]KIW02933.1 hypothetical protein PV09_05979 [Verruconis gallopava]